MGSDLLTWVVLGVIFYVIYNVLRDALASSTGEMEMQGAILFEVRACGESDLSRDRHV